MAFDHSYFKGKPINNVIHVGADRAGEITQYMEMGVKRVVWIEANPEVYAEMLHLLPQRDPQKIVESLTFNRLVTDHENYYRGSVTLQSITLDTLCNRENLGYDWDLLNMDTQGSELLISQGARQVLANVRYINSEVTLFDAPYSNNVLFPELAGFLATMGFRHIHTELSEANWGDAIFEKI